MSRQPRFLTPGRLLLLAGLLLVLFTFRDYGITWDESAQARYGELVLDYFRSGLTDTRCNELSNLRFYGPIFDLTAASIYRFWPDARFEIRHLLNALAGLGTVVATYRLGLRLGGRRLAVLAALFLVTLPRFYGDAFNNPKDIPFACAFAWFLLALTRTLQDPAPGTKRVLACSLAMGLTLAVRPGGFPLVALLAVAAAGYRWLALQEKPRVAVVAPRMLVVLAVAWLVMVSVWPWAHRSPVSHPFRAMAEALSFSEAYEVLFQGKVVMSDHLPRYYPIKYLLIATPLATLSLALFGLWASLREQTRDWRSEKSFLTFVIGIWLFAPLVLFVAKRPNVYDGIRHFLFLLPALALLAALGASRLVAMGKEMGRERLALGLVVLVLLLPVISLVRLHPYQTTYFNILVGGVEGAAPNYETDYWASSYKEAAEWINGRYEAQGRNPTVVQVAANPFSIVCLTYYLRPDIRVEKITVKGLKGALPEGVDYYVATTRFGVDRNYAEAPIVHTVGRAGAVFTVIRGRTPAS